MEKEKRKKEESLRLAEEREEMRKKKIEEEQAKLLATEPDQDDEALTQGSKWNDAGESRPPSDEEHSGDEQAFTAAPQEEEIKKGETIVDILAKLSREEQEASIASFFLYQRILYYFSHC
jgi:hypothetical protein